MTRPHTLGSQYATGGAYMRGMALSHCRDPLTWEDCAYCLDAPEAIPVGSTYEMFVFEKPGIRVDMRPGYHA